MQAKYRKFTSENISSQDSKILNVKSVDFVDFKPSQSAQISTISVGDDSFTCVKVSKRYKIYSETAILIKIISGTGFIKWQKGEIDFEQGDIFAIETDSEIDINGACSLILRNDGGKCL